MSTLQLKSITNFKSTKICIVQLPECKERCNARSIPDAHLRAISTLIKQRKIILLSFYPKSDFDSCFWFLFYGERKSGKRILVTNWGFPTLKCLEYQIEKSAVVLQHVCVNSKVVSTDSNVASNICNKHVLQIWFLISARILSKVTNVMWSTTKGKWTWNFLCVIDGSLLSEECGIGEETPEEQWWSCISMWKCETRCMLFCSVHSPKWWIRQMNIISRSFECAGQATEVVSVLNQGRKMCQNWWKFQGRNAQTTGYVYHDTHCLSPGPICKVLLFFSSEIITVVFLARLLWEKHFWKIFMGDKQ